MIYLQKLQLINFQKHKELTLEFDKGVNILYGVSGAGKSCVRRAIEFLHGGSLKDIRKEGSKQTSVKGWYSNGIILERIRSTSINRFVLNDGKGLISTFDAVGKEVPEEIKNVLPFYNIEIDDQEINLNFASQINLPFLFDLSGTTRMKLFNKFSGNEILDKLFVQFNKDILGINRSLKGKKEKIETQKETLQNKEIEKEKLEYKYQKAQNFLKTLEEVSKEHEKLKSTLEALNNHKNQLNALEATLNKQIDISSINLADLVAKIGQIEGLMSLLEKLEVNKAILAKTLNLEEQYKNTDNIDLEDLKLRFNTIEQIENILTRQKECDIILQKSAIKEQELNNEFTELKNEEEKLFQEMGTCPVCKREITEECIKELING